MLFDPLIKDGHSFRSLVDVCSQPMVLYDAQLFPQRPARFNTIEEFLEKTHSLKLAVKNTSRKLT